MTIKKLSKKLFGLFCLVLAVVALFSCAELTESASLAARRTAEKNMDTVLSKIVWDASDASGITANLELPTSNKNFPGITVSWKSSEPDVISSTGVVTRTAYDDPRAYVADGSESETYTELDDNNVEVVKYKDKVVKVVLTATVSGTYTYDVEKTDADGNVTFEPVEKELNPISKDFTFTVLTIPHGIFGGSVAEVKAAAWNYVYNENKVDKKLVSNSNVVFNAMTKGFVTAKLQSGGLGFMIHDGSEGIYVYFDNTKVEVGDYVQVIGGVYTYYGSLQFGSNISVSKLETPEEGRIKDSDYREVTPLQLEAEHAPLESGLYADNVVGYFGGKLVKITGILTAKAAPQGSGKYCLIDATDGEETTWIYYKSYTPEMEQTLKDLAGKYVELRGVTYDRDSRLNKNELLWDGQAVEKEAPEMSDEVKVKQALGSIVLEDTYDADFVLPTVDGFTVSWAVKSGTGVELNGVNAKVTRADEDQTVVLTATVTLNAVSESKDFTIKVAKIVTYKYYPTNNPVAGVKYVLGLTQTNLQKDLFFTGNPTGNYLETTDDFGVAAKVSVLPVNGGFNLAIHTADGVKYINAESTSAGKAKPVVGAEAVTVWTFNTEYNTFVTTFDTDTFYIGTYSNYNTLSMSKISYAATSFVSHLYAEEEYQTATEVAENVEYLLYVRQEKVSKDLYCNGVQSGNFLATVENPADAVKVTLVAVNGGYNVVINASGALKYINAEANGAGKAKAVIGDTASTVWAFNTEYNTLTTVVDENTFYMGTYSSYTTFSMSTMSYAATSYVSHLVLPTNIVKELSDEDKCDAALATISLKSSYSSDFELPKVEGFEVTWTVKSGTAVTIDGGTAKVTRLEADDTVVLTVKVQLNDAYVTKDFTFTVPAAEANELVMVTSPVAETAYVLSLVQENADNARLFFNGNQSGNFLASASSIENAATVILKATEDGFHLSFGTETVKYINAVENGDGKAKAVIGDTASTVWTFNTDYNTLVAVVAGETFYIGTYNTYTTFSMSKISFAATSFVSHLYVKPEIDPTPGPTPQPTGDYESVAKFTLGDNSDPTHKEGTSKEEYSETVGNYTLNITDGVKFFTGASDAKGNSCLKLGASKATGSFKFVVPSDVTKVVIRVAGYKANTGNFKINGGTEQTTSTASDNGEYSDVVIDTSTNKTILFETLSAGKRLMINEIEWFVSK